MPDFSFCLGSAVSLREVPEAKYTFKGISPQHQKTKLQQKKKSDIMSHHCQEGKLLLHTTRFFCSPIFGHRLMLHVFCILSRWCWEPGQISDLAENELSPLSLLPRGNRLFSSGSVSWTGSKQSDEQQHWYKEGHAEQEERGREELAAEKKKREVCKSPCLLMADQIFM